MNIVIDNAIVEGYVSTLATYQTLLDEAQKRAEALQQRADADQLLTIRQACDYLSVSEDSLLYYRKNGLEYYKKGREGVWYRKGDIDTWLASGKVSRQSAA